MVSTANEPEYDLAAVKAAAKKLNIEFRDRKTRLDVLNLDYELKDVTLCLQSLSPANYRKTIRYENHLPDDEYICDFTKPGTEHLTKDRLYIQFCFIEHCLTIDLGSFHLARY